MTEQPRKRSPVRTIVLRARSAPGLAVGMLIGSPKGRVVYRVLEVTRVRRWGDARAARVRLVCRRLRLCEVPGGVPVHPWPKDRQAPPRRSRTAPVAAVRRSPEEMALLIAASRRAERAERAIRRAALRETHYGVDVGPVLRLAPVTDGHGTVIREADVTIATAGDAVNRTVRRAVRADPLVALQRAGSITGRELEACETLRSRLEGITPPLGQSGGMPVHVAPFLRKPISIQQIEASEDVREAAAALGRRWEAVLWVCLGGTVDGYSAYRSLRTHDARKLVHGGIAMLADHFETEGSTCRP